MYTLKRKYKQNKSVKVFTQLLHTQSPPLPQNHDIRVCPHGVDSGPSWALVMQHFFFFFSFIFISWRLITLQYCSGFCHTLTWISHGFTCVPHPDLPSPSHPSGSSQCTSPEHLSHASNLGWWSVSPLMIYLFQRYSLRTSHPRFLPQSPKVCSIHLCLFFCFAYTVIITIFLNSMYMH